MNFIPFLFSLSISARVSTTIETVMPFASIGDFGFDANGVKSTEFFRISNEVLYVEFDKHENKMFANERLNITKFCQNPFGKIHILSNTTTKLDAITYNTSGTRYYKLVRCNSSSPLSAEKGIKAYLRNTYYNPTTRLDNRWRGIIKAKTIVVFLYSTALAVWLLNWFRNFRIRIYIHLFFTISFFLAQAEVVIRLFELIQLDKFDETPFLTSLHIIITALTKIVFFTTLCLAAKGWCIIRDTIEIKEIVSSVFYPLFLTSIISVSKNIYTGQYELILYFSAFLVAVMFVRGLIHDISNASNHIMAHLLASMQDNNRGSTDAPIYKKQEMYQDFQISIIVICVIVLIQISLSFIEDFSFCMIEITANVTEVILIFAIYYIFRIQPTNTDQYISFERQRPILNEADAEDIELVNINIADDEDLEKPKENEGKIMPAIIHSPDGAYAETVEIEQNDNFDI